MNWPGPSGLRIIHTIGYDEGIIPSRAIQPPGRMGPRTASASDSTGRPPLRGPRLSMSSFTFAVIISCHFLAIFCGQKFKKKTETTTTTPYKKTIHFFQTPKKQQNTIFHSSKAVITDFSASANGSSAGGNNSWPRSCRYNKL